MSKLMDTDKSRIQSGLILSIGLAMALLLRISLLEFESADYLWHTSKWIEFIRQNGGLRAFRFPFSNYAPSYLYLLLITQELFHRFPDVVIPKIPSIVFDFILAYYGYRIVRLKYGRATISLSAFLLILFLPTVVLNRSLWGHADAAYTACLVGCVYYLMTKREIPAFIAFGLSLSLKVQAIFLAPLLAILLLRKQVSLKSFLIIPGIYLLTILPAWLVGRPLPELLTIYLGQSEQGRLLAANAPTMYKWFPNSLYNVFNPAGVVLAAAIALLFCFAVYRSRLKLSAGVIIQLATISTLMMPFFLPKMHDRYFFPADLFSTLYAFYYPRYFFIPLMVVSVSLFSYFPFLFHMELISLKYMAVVLLLTIAILLMHLASTASAQQGDEALA